MSYDAELKAAAVGTRLITEPDDKLVLSHVGLCDARTALMIGVAEYIESLNWVLPDGGREVAFRRVLSHWAEPEDSAEYPSAFVTAEGSCTYDAQSFTPNIGARHNGLNIIETSELACTVNVEVWSNDPDERMQLAKMLEDALSPVDWMHGMRLELPHYYNQRATFEMSSINYRDSASDAMRRYRTFALAIKGSVPVTRVKAIPELKLVRRTIDVLEPPRY